MAQSWPALCDPMNCSQAVVSMKFFRQEYWSGLPFPSPGDLPNPGIKPRSYTLQADALPSEPPGKPQEYWSGLLSPPPGDLSDPGIEPESLASPILQEDSLTSESPGKPLKYW